MRWQTDVRATALRRSLQGLRYRDSRRVLFFHRVGDAWSWLAAQLLAEMARAYDLEVEVRMLSAMPVHAVHDPDRYDAYAAYDCQRLADAWTLRFTRSGSPPDEVLQRLASRIILARPTIDTALAATTAAWCGGEQALSQLASELGAVDEPAAQTRQAANLRELQRRGHYLSAMTWHAGEWYWGVDRLAFLEQRLAGERDSAITARFEPIRRQRAGTPQRQSLEFYFSFRSPYSYLATSRVIDLADRLGLDLELHPLLPLAQRGIPVAMSKIRYILRDAARCAREQQIDFAPRHDPLGQGVEYCLAVVHAAQSAGRGREFMLAAMRAIWAEGMAVNRIPVLRRIAAQAEIDAQSVDQAITSMRWRAAAEASAAKLSVLGLWGVPVMCLRGFDQNPVSVAWGHDRVWAIERAALGLDRPVPLPGAIQ
ncbi:MAG: DsbA family protein [Gammaproteobacteria bacterium]|nr:DsbA family protein [Gammaproteobacteria bacterium]